MNPSKAHVLIVDDDPSIRRQIGDRMASQGHRVEEAATGAVALQMLRRESPDLAILDLGLPGVSGDVVAAAIRQADPSIVTILMTGWILEESDPRRSHFDLSLQKPFDADEIEKVIKQALSLRDTRRGPTVE